MKHCIRWINYNNARLVSILLLFPRVFTFTIFLSRNMTWYISSSCVRGFHPTFPFFLVVGKYFAFVNPLTYLLTSLHWFRRFCSSDVIPKIINTILKAFYNKAIRYRCNLLYIIGKILWPIIWQNSVRITNYSSHQMINLT